MWTLHKQQQHRGAQLHARAGKPRQPDEVPDEAPNEAVRDRAAQEHDRAGGTAQPGDYPASSVENRNERAPAEAGAAWDEVVQPEHKHGQDDQPPPDGK
jgi:hypothetical protein